MSSKVLEGGLGFWLVALISLAAIASFDSSFNGVSSQLDAASAERLLSDVGGLLRHMGQDSTVTVFLPSGPHFANLTMNGDVLSVVWSSGMESEELEGLSGSFSLIISGTVSFTVAGGQVEAAQDG